MTIADLINWLAVLINQEDSLGIYADSSDPSRITEIQQAGYNVIGVKKTPNSVKAGIDFVKRFTIHVHEDSYNLIREFKGYKWREDRQGNVLDEPVKINDHLMDALRYAVFSHFFSVTPRIRVI